jgi:signal transduction histidine kinase
MSLELKISASGVGLPIIHRMNSAREQGFRRRRAALVLLWLAALAASAFGQGFALAQGSPAALLTHVQQVLALGTEGARTSAAPARLRGVVTYPNSKKIHFYLQDSTAGLLVTLSDTNLCPEFAQEVEVTGTTGASGGQVYIEASAVRVIGPGKLPVPRRVSVAEAAQSTHFAQWLEVEGVVMQFRHHTNGGMMLHLAGDNGWAMVNVSEAPRGFPAGNGWGARVRVHALHAGPPPQALLARKAELLTVLAPGRNHPFDEPLTNAAALLRAGRGFAERTKVRGTVLETTRDGWVFLRDGTTAFQADFLYPFSASDREWILPKGVTPVPKLRRGDVVELVGSPFTASPHLSLRYSQFRVLNSGDEPEAVRSDLATVLAGRVVNDLVTVRGRLMDHSTFAVAGRSYETLKLKSRGAMLDVVVDSSTNSQLASLKVDDLIQATGIVQSQEGAAPYRLHLRSAAGLQSLGLAPEIIQVRRLRMAGIIAGFGLAAGAWIVFLRGKLAREHDLALERASAATAVRELNVQLERRVVERTAELEKAKEELHRALAVERELGELKSRFVSLVSHEFRTPLGITMSAVELLRNYLDRLPPAKLKELLDDIYRSTLRMSGLMEQVLLLGRVEAGKIGFKPAPIDLRVLGGKLVDEVLSLTNRKCPLKFRCEGEIDDAAGDEGLLRHIFSNLLSNAVKYSPEGTDVEFRVARDGDDAKFTVRDRGIGIPEADCPRLFEAFHRAGNVGETPGTGLGLLIVKRCVELHRGSIGFESRVGEGTTFTVRLPLFARKPQAQPATELPVCQ